MEYIDINSKINEAINSGLYDKDQIEVIKYVYHRMDLDASKILNPSIPANYMSMYIRLMGERIDVSPYINNEWHNKGYDEKSLENLIKAHISNPKFLEQYPNLKIDLKKDIENIDLFNMLDPDVKKFLELQSEYHNVNGFIDSRIVGMDLKRVAYLLSLYDEGYDISNLLDNNLTYDEMKQRFENSDKIKRNQQNVRKV